MSWMNTMQQNGVARSAPPTSREFHQPAVWASQVRQRFFPLDLTVARDDRFNAKARLAEYPQCRMAQISASAHVASMSRLSCSELRQRYVKVLWELDGMGWLDQSGHEICLPPAHFTIYEASRPYSIRMESQSAFVVLLCEVAPNDLLASLAQRVAGRSLPTTGGAAVALAAVQEMVAQGETISHGSRFTVLEFVSSLLAQQINALEGASGTKRKRSQDELLREAVQYIRCHMSDGDLSPDRIASALNICRRTLYHAFSLIGETPQATVQRLRLERCRNILTQHGAEKANITDLALQYGFSDPAYFARLFRRMFGVTPSQCRDDGGAAPEISALMPMPGSRPQ
ncbi:MAG: AraC family transcriptional regulator [Azonexus sp.]|jgi:AraC-like DNA-binding protein|nr:AraC family transcriptional regulator [Azonexus sp.]